MPGTYGTSGSAPTSAGTSGSGRDTNESAVNRSLRTRVQHVKASELSSVTAQTTGMQRLTAITTASPSLGCDAAHDLSFARSGCRSLVVGIEGEERDSGGYPGKCLGYQVYPQCRPGEHSHHRRTQRHRRVERAT
jgi:hypothetical protein